MEAGRVCIPTYSAKNIHVLHQDEHPGEELPKIEG